MTKVDTSAVLNVASSIQNANKIIASKFETLQKKASTLDAAWDGKASENAMAAFHLIKSRFPKPRYNELENAARVLTIIATGYEKTEAKNKSLAEQFK